MKAASSRFTLGIIISMIFLISFISSCKEVDIALINSIKTFGPKWVTMGQKMDFLDRNLTILENRLERDKSELEPLFNQIPDTLSKGKFWLLISRYDAQIELRDSMRNLYKEQKEIYVSTVESFNEWEKKVMTGDVLAAIAKTELTQFKLSYNRLDEVAEKSKKNLYKITDTHNSILKELTELLEVYTNYNIEIK